MAIAGAVALAVAERVEKTGGPRAGLVAYRALAANAADGDTRGKALIAGIRCAIELRDAAGLADLRAFWPSLEGDWSSAVATLCRELSHAKMDAVALAHAEMTRASTALALYTYARCLEVARDARAATWFARARERAEAERATRIARSSGLRRALLLARTWETLAMALAEAATLDPTQLDDGERIDLARVLLLSPSRFTRAAALGHLADAARSDDADVRFRARRLAARYADEAADAMSPLEHDRLSAFLKDALHAPAPVGARAQDLLRGRYEVPRIDEAVPSEPVSRRIARHHQVLDVFAALRDKAPARASHALRGLVTALESDERLPREAVAVAQAALSDGDTELRATALRFFEVWLERPSFIVPPRGFLALADALGDAGASSSAEACRRAAALRKEPGAAASLAILLTRVGWEAAREDNRPHAIRTLREAKALSTG